MKDKKHGQIKFFVVMCCAICFNTCCIAQNAYTIYNYSSDNGLPQNSVKSISFDRKGFCWLATEAGLARWDNSSFKVFGHDNVSGMRSERISRISMTPRGDLFAQNMDGQNFKIEDQISYLSGKVIPLKHKFLYSYPWMGYLIINDSITKVWEDISKNDFHLSIRQFVSCRNGDAYLPYKDELFYFKGKEIKKIKNPLKGYLGFLLVGDRYFVQFKDFSRISIWQQGNQLGQNKISGDILKEIDRRSDTRNMKMLWSTQGSFVFINGNLYSIFFDGHSVSSKLLLSDLPFNDPLCICYNQQVNTFFIGTSTHGLYVVRPSEFTYPFIPTSIETPNFYTLAKTSNDQVFTKNLIINGLLGKKIDLFNDNSVASYVDKKDRLYFEREFFLCRYDIKRGVTDSLVKLDERLRGLTVSDKKDCYWVFTQKSIFEINEKGKVLVRKTPRLSGHITCILSLGRGIYLLGTSNGLKLYDLNTNLISASVLNNYIIRSVYLSANGSLWISTDGSGAFLIFRKKIYMLPLGPNNALKAVHSFIENRGSLWLPTNNGIYKVKISQLINDAISGTQSAFFYMYNKKNGLKTNEFNGGGFPNHIWLRDSTLVLPSMDGIVEFRPNQILTVAADKPICIDKIVIDSHSVDLVNLSTFLVLQPDFNDLSVHVTCPYFGNSENLQLEYALESPGMALQWLPLPSSGIISINRLPSAKYLIHIRKKGMLNSVEKDLTIPLWVHPHFYETARFRISIAIAIIILVGLFIRLRIRILKKEKEKIQKLVTQRTLELHRTISLLAKSENALKQSNRVKDQIITMVMHDLRSPVRFLDTMSNHIVTNFEKTDSKSVLQRLVELNGSIGSVHSFVEQFFLWAVTQRDSFKTNVSRFYLSQVFHEVSLLYKDILFFNKNALIVSETKISCNTDRQILTLIIRNIIDNANKNTFDGIISLYASEEKDIVSVCISDTGAGLSQSEVCRFINASKGVEDDHMGSFIILNMLEKIYGTLEIRTLKGKGSLFILKIPK